MSLYTNTYMNGDSYKDNPLLIEDRIATLSDRERAIFDFGYATALYGLLEQIQDSKNRILSRAVVTPGKLARIELLSRVHLLDLYEQHYTKRLETIEGDLLPS